MPFLVSHLKSSFARQPKKHEFLLNNLKIDNADRVQYDTVQSASLKF